MNPWGVFKLFVSIYNEWESGWICMAMPASLGPISEQTRSCIYIHRAIYLCKVVMLKPRKTHGSKKDKFFLPYYNKYIVPVSLWSYYFGIICMWTAVLIKWDWTSPRGFRCVSCPQEQSYVWQFRAVKSPTTLLTDIRALYICRCCRVFPITCKNVAFHSVFLCLLVEHSKIPIT